ncbi:hypothetical protein [Pontimicrobium sp. MEBiC06410]
MKFKKNIWYTFLISFMIIHTSCKNDKKITDPINENKEVVNEDNSSEEKINEDELRIKMEFIVSEGGLFQFVFKSEENPVITKTVYKSIKKLDEFQSVEVIYDLKENDFPHTINLILGHETPKTIIFNQIEFRGDGNTLNLDCTNLNDYFIFNGFVKFSSDSKKLTTSKIDDRHLPIIALRQSVLDSLLY